MPERISEEVLKELHAMIGRHIVAAKEDMETALDASDGRQLDVSIKLRIVDIGDIQLKTSIGFPTGKYKEEDERVVQSQQQRLKGV